MGVRPVPRQRAIKRHGRGFGTGGGGLPALRSYAGLVFFDEFTDGLELTSLNGTASSDGNAKRIVTDTEGLVSIEHGRPTSELSAPATGTDFECEADCHIRLRFTVE